MINMPTKPNLTYLFSFLLFIGLLLSGYLLFHHYALLSGQAGGPDLCSTVFGKGCNNALLSPFSGIWGIPLGGWGLIYLIILSVLFFFSRWLSEPLHDEMIQAAFWISLIGIIFSTFFILTMIRFPVLFCPFCTAFHIINFSLFICLKKITGRRFSELFKNLRTAIGFVLLAKPLPNVFERWKWLPFIVALFAGLIFLQYLQIENLHQKNARLAKYDPLKELEKYEARDLHNFSITPDMPFLGPADAPVTLVVYSDFQCPTCAMLSSNFQNLIKYNQGKLKIYFKHFPLGQGCNPEVKKEIHPISCEAARAAEAARQQGFFWAYHDSLFKYLQNKTDPVILFDIARSMGLNMEKFSKDYQSDTCKQIISDNINEAIKLKIDVTPAAYLNGRQVFDMRENSLNLLIKFLAH